MERGRVAETELMPKLVEGYTELGCSKWKKWKGFLKPNFELGPKSPVRFGDPVGLFVAFLGLGECLRCTLRGLIFHWCSFLVHRYPFWKDLPCGFGANVNMLTDLNLWVSVYTTQGDPVNFPLVCTAHC